MSDPSALSANASGSSASSSKRKRESDASSSSKKSRKDEPARASSSKHKANGDGSSPGKHHKHKKDKPSKGGSGEESKKHHKKSKHRQSLTEAGDSSIGSIASATSSRSEPAGTSPSSKAIASGSGSTTQYRVSKLDPPQSAYQQMFPRVHMPIPPVHASSPVRAVAEVFDTMVMRYVPELQGVLIAHSDQDRSFQKPNATIDADSAYAVVSVGASCIVWSPKIGMRLEGKILLSAPSHVSLLLQGTFNASISAPHISEKHWEFIYNDADGFEGKSGRAGKSTGDGEDSLTGDAAEDSENKQEEEEDDEEDYSNQSIGYWRNKKDGTRLGEDNGKVAFTVISMTVANGMLSLHGSLLKRPFSVPPPSSEETKLSLLPQQQIAFGSLTHGANESIQGSGKRVRWHDEEEEDDVDDDEAGGMDVDDQVTISKQSSRNTKQRFAPLSKFSKATGAAVQSQGKKITFDD